ncbi:MAG TPA: HAD-IA family hydrolase [Candidatus Binatia bacterium]|nr:HAD-IA family hydrolase [Candidatus Binatia bacterium]
MHLGAVTLDAAGTLFEPVEPIGVTYARVAARHGIVVAPNAVERGFADAFAAAPPLAFPKATPATLADEERTWWSSIVRAALGVEPTPAFATCFAELYEHYGAPATWRVFDEVPDTLRALRNHGLKVAVVSNFDRRLDGLVAGLGLAPLVDAVVSSTRAGAAKPAPDIFHTALRALSVTAAAALHAGDSVVADVAGARAAGLRAVLVDRHTRRPLVPADTIVVTTLAELARVVAVTDMPR